MTTKVKLIAVCNKFQKSDVTFVMSRVKRDFDVSLSAEIEVDIADGTDTTGTIFLTRTLYRSDKGKPKKYESSDHLYDLYLAYEGYAIPFHPGIACHDESGLQEIIDKFLEIYDGKSRSTYTDLFNKYYIRLQEAIKLDKILRESEDENSLAATTIMIVTLQHKAACNDATSIRSKWAKKYRVLVEHAVTVPPMNEDAKIIVTPTRYRLNDDCDIVKRAESKTRVDTILVYQNYALPLATDTEVKSIDPSSPEITYVLSQGVIRWDRVMEEPMAFMKRITDCISQAVLM